ncbi:hypothetical protein CROQUDRAFT_665077 [Cronartium quercuum f. sp. fusiforme G11]|uniref:Uncharacterized protein n=1 Tax=Cronartium quercuum f. sp. fusiforme G11 TaxID=708437 RepID=A0A9P6N6H2_9BASI|nr:hypothetical protein CROQUDRAFT_665077 [Cronartium quercuum f. sp. fusiforme G11]
MSQKRRKDGHENVTVMEMPQSWTCFLEGLVDADFEGLITVIENLSGRKMIPRPMQILQLVALVVEPVQCLTNLRVHTHHPDPFEPGPKKMASHAFQCLISLMRVAGADVILRCMPGFKLDSEVTTCAGLTIPMPRQLMSTDAICFMGETETPMLLLVKRMADKTSVWDLILDQGLSEPLSTHANLDSTDHNGVRISPGAWDFLELLSVGWELDYELESVAKGSSGRDVESAERLSYSPHLLRQFSHQAVGGRVVDGKLLKIIFYPFSPASASETLVWGRLVNSREEARKLTIRILGMLFDLETAGKLDTRRLIQDMVNLMNTIPDLAGLQMFVNSLPVHHSRLNATLLLATFEAITRGKSRTGIGLSRTDSQTSTSSNLSLNTQRTSSTLRRQVSQSRLRLGTESVGVLASSNLPSLKRLIANVLGKVPMEIGIEVGSDESAHRLSRMKLAEAEMRHKIILLALLGQLRRVFVSQPAQEGTENEWTTAVQGGELRRTLIEANNAILAFEDTLSDEMEAEGAGEEIRRDLKMCRRRFERCLRNY